MNDNYKSLEKFVLEYADDCPGAVDIVFNLLAMGSRGLGELLVLKDLGIKGTDLYTLWSDCSGKDMVKFLLSIRALESGVYTQSEIKHNFSINTIDKNPKTSYYDDYEFLKDFGRLVARPFVYMNIDPENYITDMSIIYDQPKHPEFKKFMEANRSIFRFLKLLEPFDCRGKDIQLVDDKEIKFKTFDYMAMDDDEYRQWAWKNYNSSDSIYLDGERYVQDTNQEEQEVVISIKQLNEVMGDTSNKKFYDEKTRHDLLKIYEWLKVARNSFLPSFVVTKNMPLKEIKNFYINGNDKRYGKLIQQSGYKEFLEQEGLFKIAYLLGLFDSSANVSEKAYNFIASEMLSKNLPSDQLHKLYGHAHIYNGFNKNFAEFFMIHYKENPHCFENEYGVDLTLNIYYQFDKILKYRSEKEIKTNTNRNRLMPSDVIGYLSDPAYIYNFPREYTEFIREICKYSSISSSIEANEFCKLYEEAKLAEIRENTIPIISGKVDGVEYRILKKTDVEAFVVGSRTNCCFNLNGASRSSFIDSLMGDSRVVVFEGKNSYIQGWVWYDEDNQFLCIDNLEGYLQRFSSESGFDLMKLIITFANEIRNEMNKNGIPCKKVNLGLRYIRESIMKLIDEAEKDGLIVNEKNPKIDYCLKRNLYSDAITQMTVVSDELKKVQTKIIEKSNLMPSNE